MLLLLQLLLSYQLSYYHRAAHLTLLLLENKKRLYVLAHQSLKKHPGSFE